MIRGLVESRSFWKERQFHGRELVALMERAGRSDWQIARRYSESRIQELAQNLMAFGRQVMTSDSDDLLVSLKPGGQGRRLLGAFVFADEK